MIILLHKKLVLLWYNYHSLYYPIFLWALWLLPEVWCSGAGWESREMVLLGEAYWLKLPTLTRHHSNHLHELFMTGGPAMEHGTNKPPPTGRIQERSKGDTTSPTTSQNPSLWHPSWLNKACTTRKDSESEWLAKDSPETNPIIKLVIKLKTASQVAELFSWVPLRYCSPPGALSQ